MTQAARHYRWDDMPKEKLNDLLDRRLVTGERMMLAHVYLKKGCVVPRHSHENEQITYILEGALHFWLGEDEKEEIVRARGRGADHPVEPAAQGARRSRTRSTSTSSARRGRTGSTRPTPTCAGAEAVDLGCADKVALVAAGEPGARAARSPRELAAEGAAVVMCARGEARAGEAAREIAAGDRARACVPVVADVSKPRRRRAARRGGARRAFGRVDMLVTNSGGPPAGTFETPRRGAWQAARSTCCSRAPWS